LLFTDEELRDGNDEPGVLDGIAMVDGGFEVRSMRGGSSGTATRSIY
jgi:hypothetical protein